MKPVIVFAVLLMASTTFAQKSKLTTAKSKYKTYKPSDLVPTTGRPYFDTIIDGETFSLRRWEVLGDTAHDNNVMRYIAKLCFHELNARRKKMGKYPLIWDERLKPAAEHHSYYLDYVYFHSIDPDKDGWYMTHSEDYDVPNFKETEYRISFVDEKYPNVFEEINECLAGAGGLGNITFNDACLDVINQFNNCKYHWADLTDTTDNKWDAIYIYISPNNGVATVVPGRYYK